MQGCRGSRLRAAPKSLSSNVWNYTSSLSLEQNSEGGRLVSGALEVLGSRSPPSGIAVLRMNERSGRPEIYHKLVCYVAVCRQYEPLMKGLVEVLLWLIYVPVAISEAEKKALIARRKFLEAT